MIHHTNCGMETFTDETTRKLLKHSLKTASLDKDGRRDVGNGPGSPEGDFIDWLTISYQRDAVIEDVQRVRSHPLVPRDIPIYGYIYDVTLDACWNPLKPPSWARPRNPPKPEAGGRNSPASTRKRNYFPTTYQLF